MQDKIWNNSLRSMFAHKVGAGTSSSFVAR